MQLKKLAKVTLLGVLPLTLSAGSLTGTVTYKGQPPKARKLRMEADPVCSASHAGDVYSESFIINEKGNLANVLVYLTNIEFSGDPPTSPAILDQQGCIYTPHVMGVMAGQEVKILNSDGTMHNIHGLPKVNREFNFAMPKFLKEKSLTFDKPEAVFAIKCDVHPWMKSYLTVFNHPYFAVTGPDGSYRIENIPAGTYEVVAWQEKFGSDRTITAKVTIGADDTRLDFTFERPQKKE